MYNINVMGCFGGFVEAVETGIRPRGAVALCPVEVLVESPDDKWWMTQSWRWGMAQRRRW